MADKAAIIILMIIIIFYRYNISTDDYDPFNTDASHNQIK